MSYQGPPPQNPPPQQPPPQYPPAYGPQQAQPPAYGPPQQQPFPMEPPEATSIKSMLNIAGILAIIFGILFILVSLLMIYWWLTWTAYIGPYGYLVDAGRTGYMIGFVILLIFAILNFLIFFQCKSISNMVNQRLYVQAKSKTLIWMILGFILAGVLVGVLLLIAYLKFDSLIRWGQPGQPYPGQQPYYQPQPQYPPPQYPPAQPTPQQPPPYQPPPSP